MEEMKNIYEIFVEGNTQFVELLQKLKLFNQYLHTTITKEVQIVERPKQTRLVLNQNNVLQTCIQYLEHAPSITKFVEIDEVVDKKPTKNTASESEDIVNCRLEFRGNSIKRNRHVVAIEEIFEN
jgi:hypothetical protein